MGMDVDCAGKHEAAGRVEHLGAHAVDVAHLDDRPVLDEHVARDRRGRTDDVASDDCGAPPHATTSSATSDSVGAAFISRLVYSWAGASST